MSTSDVLWKDEKCTVGPIWKQKLRPRGVHKGLCRKAAWSALVTSWRSLQRELFFPRMAKNQVQGVGVVESVVPT